MSEEIYSGPGLIVVRLVGPADGGPDRRRWEITVVDDGVVATGAVAQTQLDALGVLNLCRALAASVVSSWGDAS